MRTFVNTILPFLLGASLCLLTYGQTTTKRQITKVLKLSNGIEWGKYGEPEYCPEGSFAMDFEAKFEDYSGLDTDETALNALKLYCFTPSPHVLTGYISSTIGSNGNWKELKRCSNGFLTAVMARVLPSQGILFDDVAVQNIRMECEGNQILTAVDGAYTKFPLGDWGSWDSCPKGSAICGIEIRYDPPSLVEDDAAVSNMRMFCCEVNQAPVTTAHAEAEN